jgi:hypothetical protein
LIHEGSGRTNLNAGTTELAACVSVGFAGARANNDSPIVREKGESLRTYYIAADADAPPAENTEVIVSIEKGLPLGFGEAFMAVGKGGFAKPDILNDPL